MSNVTKIGQQKPETEVKESVKLKDSELDSVAGGGWLDTLKSVARAAEEL